MDELLDLKQRLEQERPTPWAELPDLALYMDQIISYMPRQLIHFDEGEVLTSAMVNNYIKDGLVPRADGKRYGPDPSGLPHRRVRPEAGALRAGHRRLLVCRRGEAGEAAGGAVRLLPARPWTGR